MTFEYMEKMKYKITLTEPMLGTVPKDKKIYATYIATRTAEIEKREEEIETVEQAEEKGWTGFHKDENGLFIYDYLIRGFLKEAGNTIKDLVNLKNLKSKIDRCVFVFPRKIHLGKQEPDGVIERPLRAMTMQGPRVTLARSDYIKEGTQFEFEISLLQNKEITWDKINKIMSYGELQGLGQFRNGSYGRFVFESAK